MATTYTTTKTAAGVQAKAEHGCVNVSVTGKFTLAAALVINDVIQMVKVPNGACIKEIILTTDDLDTGTAVVLDVGDGVVSGRFISGSTIGQAGGTVRLGAGVSAANASGASAYQYTAEDTIDVKVTTAPTTSATTGDIVLTVVYSMEM